MTRVAYRYLRHECRRHKCWYRYGTITVYCQVARLAKWKNSATLKWRTGAPTSRPSCTHIAHICAHIAPIYRFSNWAQCGRSYCAHTAPTPRPHCAKRCPYRALGTIWSRAPTSHPENQGAVWAATPTSRLNAPRCAQLQHRDHTALTSAQKIAF